MNKFGRLTGILSMLLTITLVLSGCGGGGTNTPVPTNTTASGAATTPTSAAMASPTAMTVMTPTAMSTMTMTAMPVMTPTAMMSSTMGSMTPTAGMTMTGTATMSGTGTTTNTSMVGTPMPTPPPLVVDKSKLDKTLYIYNWGDYLDPDLVKQFSDEYGVQVQQDSYGSNEEMIQKLVAGGGGYDIVVPSDYAVAQMIKKGLLDTIDFSVIPNYANIGEQFKHTYFDPTDQYSVPYFWGTTGIAYDSSKISPAPDSWAVMFDPKYSGEIAMLDDEREVPGAALKLLGYSLNTTDTNQLQQAEQKLIEQKPLVKAYDATNLDNMKKGEVWLAQMYVGDAQRAQTERPSIQYIIPKEGATLWQDNISIPKGAPHKYTAEVFINFMLDAHNAATNANTVEYPTPDLAAKQYINPADLNNPILYPPDNIMGKLERIQDLGDNTQLYTRLYEEVKNH